MVTMPTAVQIALLVEGQRMLQRELEEVQQQATADRAAQNAKIAALEDERNKALKWGVLTLGSAVISLVLWIGNKFMEGHIK